MGTHKTISALDELRGTALAPDDLFMVYDQSTLDNGTDYPTKKLQYSELSSRLSTDIGYRPTIDYLNSLSEYTGTDNAAQLTTLIKTGNGFQTANLLGSGLVPKYDLGSGSTVPSNVSVAVYDSSGKLYRTGINTLPFITELPVDYEVTTNPIVYVSTTGNDGNKGNAISKIKEYLAATTTSVRNSILSQLSTPNYTLSTLNAASEVMRSFRANKTITYEIRVLAGIYKYESNSGGKLPALQTISHPDIVNGNRMVIHAADNNNPPLFVACANQTAFQAVYFRLNGGDFLFDHINMAAARENDTDTSRILVQIINGANVEWRYSSFVNQDNRAMDQRLAVHGFEVSQNSKLGLFNLTFKNLFQAVRGYGVGNIVSISPAGTRTANCISAYGCKTGLYQAFGTLYTYHTDVARYNGGGISVILDDCERGIQVHSIASMTMMGNAAVQASDMCQLCVVFKNCVRPFEFDGISINRLDNNYYSGDSGSRFIAYNDITRYALNDALGKATHS